MLDARSLGRGGRGQEQRKTQHPPYRFLSTRGLPTGTKGRNERKELEADEFEVTLESQPGRPTPYPIYGTVEESEEEIPQCA